MRRWTQSALSSSTRRAAIRGCSLNRSGINLTGIEGLTGDDNAPVLNFLSDEKALLETVQGTVDISRRLLDLTQTEKSPQLRHDLIDTTSNVLCLLLDPCEFVRQIHPDPAFKHNSNQAFMEVNEFMCEANSRRDLFEVLEELSRAENQKDGILTSQSRKNVAQLKHDMESNGIHLSDAERQVIATLNMEKDELAMQFLQERESKNPFGVLRQLLAARHRLSEKLGYESFAEQQLRGSILNDQQKVWHFLCGLTHRIRPACEKELNMILNQQGEVRSRDMITDVNRASIAATIRNNMEPKGANRYFTVGNCVRGIQCLCSEVFGVTLVEKPFLPEERFLPQAMKFHVYDAEKKFCGIIVLDMFARSSKHCQAGHLTIQLGCRPHKEALSRVGLDLGPRQYPIVALTCNAGSTIRAAKKADGTFDPEGTIMLPHEVTTCFHEFGHALHTIFAQTEVQNLSGTRSSIDYVETFSQLFELFLKDHDFLQLWAKHMGTGEPIPKSLVEERNAALTVFENMETLDQVQLASIDQTLHGPQPFTVYFPHGETGLLGKRTLGNLDEYGKGMYNFASLVMDISAPISLAKPTESGVLRTLSFEHISSYPAAYYGYLFSLQVAKRIWKKKFGEKVMNKAAGQALASEVLSLGAACNTRDTLQLYLGDDLDDVDVWDV